MDFINSHPAIMAGCLFMNGIWCGMALSECRWRVAGFYAFAAMLCVAAI